MTIEDWMQEKKKLFGGDQSKLSKGSRIIIAWWSFSEQFPAVREGMKTAAERVLNERRAEESQP